MKKFLFVVASLTIMLSFTIKTSDITICDAIVTGKNEITFYDKYDGNVFDYDCNHSVGTKVTCTIDTKGTASIYDDEIISTEQKGE